MNYTHALKTESALNGTHHASKALIELNARYRERDMGVGYGKSSGYASTRQYATIHPGILRIR